MGTVTSVARGRTMREWQQTYRAIYHKRNLWISSPSRITMQIGRELRVLSKAVDRGDPMSEKALAGLIARLFALSNFLDEDLAFLLATKYPGECPYCGARENCRCPIPDGLKQFASSAVAEGIARDWPIDDAQRMLARIYGKRNAEAGIGPVFHHLNGEYLELNDALANHDPSAFREEVADVCAWGFGVVTLSDIPSVSDLLYAHYPDVCSRCGRSPCLISGPCPPL